MAACLADRRKHGNRHCELECTGEIHHQNGKCLCGISCQKVCQCCCAKAVRYKLVCQMGCLAFYIGFHFLRFFDHLHDLFKFAVTSDLADCDRQCALFHHSARIYGCALCFSDSRGFAGQWRLVDQCFPFCHHTVKRNDITHMHNNLLSCFNFIDRHQNLCPIYLFPCFCHMQRQASCQIIDWLFMCPLFQQFTETEQKHDRTCCVRIIS